MVLEKESRYKNLSKERLKAIMVKADLCFPEVNKILGYDIESKINNNSVNDHDITNLCNVLGLYDDSYLLNESNEYKFRNILLDKYNNEDMTISINDIHMDILKLAIDTSSWNRGTLNTILSKKSLLNNLTNYKNLTKGDINTICWACKCDNNDDICKTYIIKSERVLNDRQIFIVNVDYLNTLGIDNICKNISIPKWFFYSSTPLRVSFEFMELLLKVIVKHLKEDVTYDDICTNYAEASSTINKSNSTKKNKKTKTTKVKNSITKDKENIVKSVPVKKEQKEPVVEKVDSCVDKAKIICEAIVSAINEKMFPVKKIGVADKVCNIIVEKNDLYYITSRDVESMVKKYCKDTNTDTISYQAIASILANAGIITVVVKDNKKIYLMKEYLHKAQTYIRAFCIHKDKLEEYSSIKLNKIKEEKEEMNIPNEIKNAVAATANEVKDANTASDTSLATEDKVYVSYNSGEKISFMENVFNKIDKMSDAEINTLLVYANMVKDNREQIRKINQEAESIRRSLLQK